MPKAKRDPAIDELAREQRKAGSAALGHRIRAARTMAGETLDGLAKKLTAAGIPVGKAAVGHWETGTAVPDALQLRRLAKLLGTTSDALLWDDSVSIEAIRFATQFDALSDGDRRKFIVMWTAYFEEAKSDEEVAGAIAKGTGPVAALPPPAPTKKTKAKT